MNDVVEVRTALERLEHAQDFGFRQVRAAIQILIRTGQLPGVRDVDEFTERWIEVSKQAKILRENLRRDLWVVPDQSERTAYLPWIVSRHNRSVIERLEQFPMPDTPIDRRTERALCRVSAAFDVTALLVPKRIRDEEIGDALEDISRRIQLRRPVWQIYAKCISTIFWVCVHSFGALTSSLLGKTRSG